jgi:methionyl-tRNA formyltransferase
MNERDAAASPGLLRIDRDRLFVGCRDGWIEILELQREGKAKQSAAEFLRGYRIRPDLRWN